MNLDSAVKLIWEKYTQREKDCVWAYMPDPKKLIQTWQQRTSLVLSQKMQYLIIEDLRVNMDPDGGKVEKVSLATVRLLLDINSHADGYNHLWQEYLQKELGHLPHVGKKRIRQLLFMSDIYFTSWGDCLTMLMENPQAFQDPKSPVLDIGHPLATTWSRSSLQNIRAWAKEFYPGPCPTWSRDFEKGEVSLPYPV